MRGNIFYINDFNTDPAITGFNPGIDLAMPKCNSTGLLFCLRHAGFSAARFSVGGFITYDAVFLYGCVKRGKGVR